MSNLKISSPWVNYYHEIDALFGLDPEIRVDINEGENTVTLYVDNAEKAEAIARLLPAERAFGNVTVKTKVVPANQLQSSRLGLFQRAFKGNPAFAFTKSFEGQPYGFCYVVFANKVVQYFADNLQDVNGNRSTLYEEIARDLFGEDGDVFFCTDAGAKD